MKAISINAYEIENDDGETMVFMTPKEFDFIKKQNDLKDKEIERLNNIINELEKDIKNLYTYGIKNNREQKDYLLNRLDGLKAFKGE